MSKALALGSRRRCWHRPAKALQPCVEICRIFLVAENQEESKHFAKFILAQVQGTHNSAISYVLTWDLAGERAGPCSLNK